jgi:hypothetical protein
MHVLYIKKHHLDLLCSFAPEIIIEFHYALLPSLWRRWICYFATVKYLSSHFLSCTCKPECLIRQLICIYFLSILVAQYVTFVCPIKFYLLKICKHKYFVNRMLINFEILHFRAINWSRLQLNDILRLILTRVAIRAWTTCVVCDMNERTELLLAVP